MGPFLGDAYNEEYSILGQYLASKCLGSQGLKALTSETRKCSAWSAVSSVLGFCIGLLLGVNIHIFPVSYPHTCIACRDHRTF